MNALMTSRQESPDGCRATWFARLLLLMAALLGLSTWSAGALAAVTYQAAGVAVNGTTTTGIGANPAWPAHVANDIALLFVESAGGEPVTLSVPNGFAAVPNSPQATGAGTAGTRLTVFWARATSSAMPAPRIATPSDHFYAQIITFRGVVTAGNPWDVTAGGVKAAASTSVTVTGVTTTVANALIVQAVARDNDNAAAAFSAQTNAALTNIVELLDAGTANGNGGGLGVWSGIKAAAGATGNTTATVTSSINAFITIALKPQVVAPAFQAAGTAVGAATSVSPAWPAHAIGDIALLFVESGGGEPVTLSVPATFALVPNSPQATGAGTAGTQLTVYWARATSTAMTAPTLTVPTVANSHIYAQIITYRGAPETGNPWNITGGGVKTPASTSVSVTSVTTTTTNTRVVQAVARDTDSAAAAFSAETNANLIGITERNDAGTATGLGGGFAVWDGSMAAAGGTGVTGATVASSINAFLTVALAPSASPHFAGLGAAVATGLNWPAHAVDDIALLFVESAGGQAPTLLDAQGFVEVTGSPQATGAGAAGTRITVYWARATSTAMVGPTLSGPTDHAYAQIITYRGAVNSGDPWDVTGGGVKAAASTSVSVTGVTTTVPNTRIVQVVARDTDNTAVAFSAQVNATLTGIAERSDAGTTTGGGGGFSVWDGAKATVGATGNTTATVTSSINAFFTIALKPSPAYQAAGAAVSNATTVSPAWPAHAVDDVALLFVESGGGEVVTLSVPNGFAPVFTTPPATGAGTVGTRLTVFWARAASAAMPAPTVTVPTVANSHIYARIITYRGIVNSGNPWDVTGSGVKTPASTAVSVASVTTTVPNTLIVQAVARDNDNAAAAFSAQTNATLTGIAERSDAGTNTGAGGGFAVWDGRMGAAGATGVTTATVTSSINAFATIALKVQQTVVPLVDHYAISHNGSGVTCQAEAVTVTPHTTTHTGVTMDSSIAIKITATLGPGHGGLAAKGDFTLNTGTGTFVAGTADSGGNGATATTYTFTTGETFVRFDYKNTWGQTVNFNITTIAGGAATERTGTASADSPYDTDLAISTAALRFVDTSNVSIATQTAGVTSGQYYLQAIQSSCSTPGAPCAGVCTSVFGNGQTAAIDLAYECNNPTTCSCTAVPATCAGSSLPTLAIANAGGSDTPKQIRGNNNGAALNYTTQTLTFNNTALTGCTAPCSVAPVTVNFTDVGQIKLHARYSAGTGGGGTGTAPGTPVLINGSSQFVVKPFALTLSGIKCTTADAANCGAGALAMGTPGDNPAATDADGVTFIRAGHPFSVTVTATASGGAATPNFGKEGEWVKLTPTLVAGLGLTQNPSVDRTTTGDIANGSTSLTVGSSLGYAVGDRIRVAGAGTAGVDLVTTVATIPDLTTMTLAAAASTDVTGSVVNYMFPTFSGGSATATNWTWGEVGIIRLTPSVGDGNYLGTGAYTGTTSANVGRFYPHHFGFAGAVQTRSDLAAGSTFTYMGEPMMLTLTTTAYNAVEGVTQNYVSSATAAENFAKLHAATMGTGANWFNTGCTGTTECMGLGAMQGTTGLSARLGIDTTVAYGSATPASNWAAGVGTFTLNTVFARPAGSAVDGPYDALQLGGMPRDSDGVTLPGPAATDTAHRADFDATTGDTLASNPDATNERRLFSTGFTTRVRYGRLRLASAYGSDLLPLRLPVSAEYCATSSSGSCTRWLVNIDDSLTPLVPANVAIGNVIQASGSSLAFAPAGIVLGTLNTGTTTLVLTPSTNGAGSADIALNLGASGNDVSCASTHPAGTTAGAQPWLRFDWCAGATVQNDPSARAKFGSPKAPYIYLRERY